MNKENSVVIVSAKRSPIGSFQGAISSISAPKLGSLIISNILEETTVDPFLVDEIIMGNVLSAGIGQAPARQAAIGAGMPDSVECLTINKMCGSGLKAVMLGSQAIQVNDANIIIAGGFESMSQSPYLVPKARAGYRLGHGNLIDSVIFDGLWDVYNDIHMGNCAEICARDRGYSIIDQNDFAKESYQRAINAQEIGAFNNEIVSIEVKNKNNTITFDNDEEPKKVNFEKMDTLKPVFEKDGTITAANASTINDGAACLLMMSENKASELGFKPLARIISQASAAQDPKWFTTAPIEAIKKVLTKVDLTVDDIDLWEINEAFAPVVMAVVDDYNLDYGKININGGAIALGHPIGASGARILTTLIHSLNQKEKSLGLATICIGGGEASAVIIERIN
ncbi:MAG: thiolase family protein [Candidatus Neomarinimicrobiota bacterium]|jgi:acetyl-CoA C-acetyltransferase|nr:thiolase family protein [Candidatus Neomarinimicrobiota bacterium]MED5266023.1 thiolase family protein [Candidatus Neomarinimicrobiota bacterium]|tara:strand:+ start:5689 stop:6876 length:1188 start_codon:yes stop_codon:yes gene_type:complete